MALVILPLERPLDLIGVDNGNLDPGLLVPVGPNGRLHHLAARAWLSLCRAAQVAGWSLTYTYGGTYRPYADQETGFRQRYQTTPIPGRPQKQWNGQIWYQKPGVEMAAVPGTSNHGLGLAIDMALDHDLSDGIGPNDAESIAPALAWLSTNALIFGFSWESYETWHIRYVTGDHVPQAVIDWEPKPPAPDPPNPNPPPTIEEDIVVVTNKEEFGGVPAMLAKWWLMDNGRLRYLDPIEWETRGSQAGIAWLNDSLMRHGADFVVGV